MDDVYIHMAIAKNLVAHGVWGVTPWEFTSASSSPLWVALLAAGFLVLGPQVNLALILAGLSALLLLFVAADALRQASDAAKTPLAWLLALVTMIALVLFTSLPALTLQGMEHPLHGALLLLAALGVSRIVADQTQPFLPGYLALFAALALLRYESLWLVALAALLLLWRRRYGLAALSVLSALLPIAAFGLWMVAHDNPFLPASIMSKAVAPTVLAEDGWLRWFARFTWHPLQRLWSVPLLFVMTAAASAILALRLIQLRGQILERRWLVLLGLFVVGAWSHATFATFGWGLRYEAYLVALGMVALGCWCARAEERAALRLLLARPWSRIALYGTAAMVALLCLNAGAERLSTSIWGIASREVRDRDLFIAHFLADAYPREGVVAMNIGAVSWQGEPHLTDVIALATPDMLRQILRLDYSPQSVDRLARQRGARIAVIFNDWFEDWTGGKAPWTAVVEVFPRGRRDFRYMLYVLDPADAPLLAQRFKAYRPEGHYDLTWRILPPYL
jgi:hypothetical protein